MHTIQPNAPSPLRFVDLSTVPSSVNPASVNIHHQQERNSRPDHKHEEEKRVANVSCEIRDDANDERA